MQGQTLGGRIRDYLRNVSHKQDLVKDAMLKGHELWVRVKPTRVRKKLNTERMENKLLAKYNYPWNKRNYGNRIRNILG